MQGSKSVQKRRREEETETAQNKLAKQERRERRKRGHEPVPIKGRDPAHDTREKTLISIATKCALHCLHLHLHASCTLHEPC